jgi:signal transduction histidine kinase
MRVENFSATESSSAPRVEAPVAINAEGEPWNEREIIEAARTAAKFEELVRSSQPLLAVMNWAIHRLRVRALAERQRLLEQHRAEITALNERLTKAQEEERMRIAGELHDGVLQQITSLTLRLGTAIIKLPPDSDARARIKQSQKELMQMGAEIRHLSHELHPAALQKAGLPAALSSYCEEFGKLRGIPVPCDVDETVADLSPGAALCLYRIAQEALGNVAKHSKAKQAQVRLGCFHGNVSLSISDDGVGFTPDKKSVGLGLINMRERVYQLHGSFELHSEPGRGTMIEATVPFRLAP